MTESVNKVLLRPEEAAQMLSIGRTQLFELLRNNQLESIRIGRLRRIPVSALQRFIEDVATSGLDEAGPDG